MRCGFCRKASLLALGLGGLLSGCQGPTPPAAPAPRAAARPARERRLALAPGTAALATLAGGTTHAYLFALPAGQYADLAVDQRGFDVALTLAGPDGRTLTFVDGPYGDHGPEPVPLVAETAGTYRLEVRASDVRAAPGPYALLVRALRPATEEDRTRVAAERAYARGEALRGRRDRAAVVAAIAEDQRALGLFAGLNDPARRADTLASLGWAHDALGEETAALGLFEQALALFRAQGREREMGEVLNDLGKVRHHRLGEPRRALACYREALALNHRLHEPRWEAISWNGLGKAHEALGETEEALAAYEEALALFHRLGQTADEGVALANRGRLYRELGQPAKALEDLGRALPLLAAAGSQQEADALADYGVVLSHLRQDASGVPLLERALALDRRSGDQRGAATVRNDLGLLHSWLGDREAARRDYEAAAAAYRALGYRPDEALAETNLAWLDVDLGRPAAAIGRLDRALPVLAAAGDRDGEADALLTLARARRGLGDLAGARQAISAALERIEALRRAPASHQMRASFLASRQEFYRFDVGLCMELDRRSPGAGFAGRALSASEEGRARSLLDMLAEAGADLRRGVDPGLLAREAELGRRMNAADAERRRLEAEGAPPTRLAAASREIAELLDLYDRAQARIRLASPRYAALALPRPLGAAEIARLLDPDTLLLEYALGDEQSFLWVVSPAGLAASFDLPPRRVIEAAARRAAFLLAQSHRTLARAEADLALAELARLVLAPAAPWLADKRLVVVADGALHYIPFAALPDPAAPPGFATPLLAGHEVVALPSASALATQRRELACRRPAPGSVAVVADPVFDAADPRLGFQTQAVPAGLYPRLPFSRQEAEAILALAPPAGRFGALDFAASRETVLSGELARYRIVHFATHAVLDTDHPELSGVVLSRVDAQGRPRDGYLRAHEIYQLHLPAELVVLSACQTALGRELRGEGLVGLTRGFQYAGARRILVSLWPVEDRATAELMRRFYRGLLVERLPPAAALRAAQLAVAHLKGWETPYYWAGFVLEGDWRPDPKGAG